MAGSYSPEAALILLMLAVAMSAITEVDTVMYAVSARLLADAALRHVDRKLRER